MSRCVGIDLGTTNSVVAAIDGPHVTVLDSKEGKPSIRSGVSLRRRKGKPDEILIGDVALDNWPMAPEDTIISIKRLMGRGVADPEVEKVRSNYLYQVVAPSDGTKDSARVVMGGKQYSPVQISAMILKKLKEDAEFRLGGEPVTDAVITVPAYFSQAQKAATRQAGQLAGLTVLKILDEPTAAAVAYGVDNCESTEPKYILVYDLGGGTFDISVLLWSGNVFLPLALEGDMWLGGDNFDQVIVDYVIKRIKNDYSVDAKTNLRFMAMLKDAAQKAKERLTSARETDIIVAGVLHDPDGQLFDVDLSITREQFEDMIRPMVRETLVLADKAIESAFGIKPTEMSDDKLTQARGDAQSQIAHVLMAGNSTFVPLVQQEVEKKFGVKKILRKGNPKQSVAIGAARVAAAFGINQIECVCGHMNARNATHCERCNADLKTVSVGTITPFTYGIQIAGDKYSVFINKGDPCPTPDESRMPKTFITRIPNQRVMVLPVYRGEQMDKASSNQKEGEAVTILPPNLSVDTPLRITLWLDGNGIFDLAATLDDGRELKPWIMKGERDQKAIEELLQVDQDFETAGKTMDEKRVSGLSDIRNKAYEAATNGDFDGTRREAANLKQKLAEPIIPPPPPPGGPLMQKAENLTAYTENIVLGRYGWTLEANTAFALTQLVEETRAAMQSGNRTELEQKVDELDKATDRLPQSAQMFINMFMAIIIRVRPSDPGEGGKLMDELSEVEEAFKARSPQAQAKLAKFAARLAVVIDGIGGGGKPMPMTIKCTKPGCGFDVPAGLMKCPKCGTPVHLPGGSKTSGNFKL